LLEVLADRAEDEARVELVRLLAPSLDDVIKHALILDRRVARWCLRRELETDDGAAAVTGYVLEDVVRCGLGTLSRGVHERVLGRERCARAILLLLSLFCAAVDLARKEAAFGLARLDGPVRRHDVIVEGVFGVMVGIDSAVETLEVRVVLGEEEFRLDGIRVVIELGIVAGPDRRRRRQAVQVRLAERWVGDLDGVVA
jgi:hypothetical protein